jgi:hypothetical protein
VNVKRIACPALILALVAMPALVCAQSPEEVTKETMLATPQWQEKYEKYSPAQELLDVIRPKLAGLKVDVYLGLWCPDSRNHVPPFLKILDVLGNPIPARYVNVPRKASRDVKYYVEDMKVERVPTFILWREGKEIGRIVENPKSGMLEDLVDLIMANTP